MGSHRPVATGFVSGSDGRARLRDLATLSSLRCGWGEGRAWTWATVPLAASREDKCSGTLRLDLSALPLGCQNICQTVYGLSNSKRCIGLEYISVAIPVLQHLFGAGSLGGNFHPCARHRCHYSTIQWRYRGSSANDGIAGGVVPCQWHQRVAGGSSRRILLAVVRIRPLEQRCIRSRSFSKAPWRGRVPCRRGYATRWRGGGRRRAANN